MTHIQRYTGSVIVILSGVVVPLADAQVPPNAGGAQPAAGAQANGNAPKGQAPPQYRRRSIVHHYPLPYPEYYHGDATGGFRNPGGVGRHLEYYPPGNQFQERGDPVRVAGFDQGFGNRAEQLQSLQVGVQRENAIMNHIDSMARPAFGVGFFGGMF
jgi:hypothetical protein